MHFHGGSDEKRLQHVPLDLLHENHDAEHDECRYRPEVHEGNEHREAAGDDGRTVTIDFWSGVEPCYVLDHVDVGYATDEVTITLFEGTEPVVATDSSSPSDYKSTYTYDELGRVETRAIQGQGT